MDISIELTLTPLKEAYVLEIKKFIKALRNSGFTIIENPLSTQIYGEYMEVMDFLVPLIHSTFKNEKAVILHLKLVKGDRSSYAPDF
jgi:uncharacterized protein YqgV (UPF0045/DUF77 family)